MQVLTTFKVIKLVVDFEVEKLSRNLSLSDFSANDSQFRKREELLSKRPAIIASGVLFEIEI